MEINKRQCKVCGEFKLRMRNGTFPNQKDSKFTDEKGVQWNGNTCPTCHNGKLKDFQKTRRKQVREQLQKDIDTIIELNKEKKNEDRF